MRLLQEQDTHLKICVYGRSGSGKTSLALTSPKPLVLLSERQGLASIREASRRLGRPMPNVVQVETHDDYRRLLTALRRIKPGDETFAIKFDKETAVDLPVPETLVIDSLTDLCRLVEIALEREAPLQTGKSGLPTKSIAHWGVQSDRVRKLVFAFRDLPMHVVFLALLDEREGNQSPMLATKKLAEQLPASVNMMGVARRIVTEGDGEQYTVQFRGPDDTLLKAMGGLDAIEPADVGAWIEKVLAPATNNQDTTETKKEK